MFILGLRDMQLPNQRIRNLETIIRIFRLQNVVTNQLRTYFKPKIRQEQQVLEIAATRFFYSSSYVI